MAKKWTIGSMLVVLSVALSMAILVTNANAEKREIIKLRVASGHPSTSLWIGGMKNYLVPEIKKRVLERTTKYEIVCEENYGGSLAKLGEILEAVQTGVVDIGHVVMVFEMSKLYPHNFPWWFPMGPAKVDMVIKASEATWAKFPYLDEIVEKRYKQKRLALVALGDYHFVSNFPIRTLEDMKGKKMAHGGPMLPWLKALGSVAVQSRLNEAYTCLQTGVYDGWAMEPNATVSFKMYEPAPHYTLVSLGAGIPNIVTINMKKWKKLPKEVQDIIAEVGKDYQRVNGNATQEDHALKIGMMALEGTEIYKLPEEERMRFAKAMDDAEVADEMAKKADKTGAPGTELSRFYIQKLIDMGYKWPCVPTIK